jgi:hypothetical protein
VTPGSAATQKGDVYSFAIILEEIVLRGGPYVVARTFMTAQEVWSVSSSYVILRNFTIIVIILSQAHYCDHFYSEDRKQSISFRESTVKTGSRSKRLSSRHIIANGKMLARNS